ncbi:MAG: hypothetical protein LAO78_15585 [Acidobacteriia bacterium]|nr:hypothetical protein [Terriglobia bacterium]
MAVHKATRSNPPAQSTHHRPDHQLKAEIFETLRHLNRGYGVALAALDRLETKDRQHAPRAFVSGFLLNYRNRTEALRALANRDLLRLLAGREEREAERFGHLCVAPEKSNRKRHRS